MYANPSQRAFMAQSSFQPTSQPGVQMPPQQTPQDRSMMGMRGPLQGMMGGVSGGRPPIFEDAMVSLNQALDMEALNDYILHKLPWVHTEGMAVNPRETLQESMSIVYAFKHITGVTDLVYKDPRDTVNVQRQHKELLRLVASHFLWGVFNKGAVAERETQNNQLQEFISQSRSEAPPSGGGTVNDYSTNPLLKMMMSRPAADNLGKNPKFM